MNTVSFVFQNSKLIKASILDNVKMGKSNATDEEVLNALRAAQCMDTVSYTHLNWTEENGKLILKAYVGITGNVSGFSSAEKTKLRCV